MRFDCTNGKTARYIVSVYNWNIDDHSYYHYYKDAKILFDKLKARDFENGTVISIYDLIKDQRKEFIRF